MDHETRLADHYGGKMHLGMVTIRDKYAEMKVRLILHAVSFRLLRYQRGNLQCFRRPSMLVGRRSEL